MLTAIRGSHAAGRYDTFLLAHQRWCEALPDCQARLAGSAQRPPSLDTGPRQRPGDISTVAGVRLPLTFNYRLPLSLRTWTRMLFALEPDLIEVGDVFHPAWCAAQVARQRNIPLVGFFHSHLAQLLGRRFGSGIERAVTRYLRQVYSQFDLVLAPSRLMSAYLAELGVARCAYQPLGVDTEVFSPARRMLDLRRVLQLPDDARLLVFAGRFSEEK